MNSIRVFIVDDDKDLAESLSIALEGSGCEVEIAHSGEEAVRIFREKDFDIAFMDVKLPGMNGVESFLEIKKMKPGAKVVMMTGYSVEQLLEQALDNGAWGILHKPIDMNVLLEHLENIGEQGVLVVDDDPDFITSTQDFLAHSGYRVFVASNGEEAIQSLRSKAVDVLILDLRMPILNGLETCIQLKKEGVFVPTIIVTAFAEEEKNALDMLCLMPFCGLLKKPFDPKDLIDTINNLKKSRPDQNDGG
jgi:two-component system, NtrC family, response regulator HydG